MKKAVTTKAKSTKAVSLVKESKRITSLEIIDLLIEVSAKEVFLKAIQKKRLKRLMQKANENKALTEKEEGYLKEMRHTIRCYLISNSSNVDYRLNNLIWWNLSLSDKYYTMTNNNDKLI